MIKKIEKLVDDIRDGNISHVEAVKMIDDWMKERYLIGLKVAGTNPKQWECLCEACGRHLFPDRDDGRLSGITVIKGKCPRCHNTATLIPVRDWMYAAGVPGVMWD
jgi:hypothetical protein